MLQFCFNGKSFCLLITLKISREFPTKINGDCKPYGGKISI